MTNKIHQTHFQVPKMPWDKDVNEVLSDFQRLLKEYFRLKDEADKSWEKWQQHPFVDRIDENSKFLKICIEQRQKSKDIEAELRRMVGYEGDTD